MNWKELAAVAPRFDRKLIPLAPGESAPQYDDAPEGFRTETDVELRTRISAALAATPKGTQ